MDRSLVVLAICASSMISRSIRIFPASRQISGKKCWYFILLYGIAVNIRAVVRCGEHGFPHAHAAESMQLI